MPRRASAIPATNAAAAWRLCLLGRPALVAADDGRTIALRPKDAALLAVVALVGPIQSERVAAMLWPTASARQADTSLHLFTNGVGRPIIKVGGPPADIAVDTKRNRVAVPIVALNRVEIYQLP